MNLGESIYNHRTRCHLSQGEMADALDISRQSVSKWENNTSVPELDKLIKMASLFGISLDALVYGKEPEAPSAEERLLPEHTPMRVTVGLIVFVFGLLGFLLSVFFGDHLRIGEAMGEIISVSIVVFGIAMIATYNFRIFALTAVVSFLYAVVCLGFLDVSSLNNYFFIFLTNAVLMVWFIILGLHANKERKTA